MKIHLNGEPHEVTATTLAGVLDELGWQTASVATARNGAFVPRAERAGTVLTDGDRIEILAPMQGG